MTNNLHKALSERILLLDGGFGTMMQQNGFAEADYRGSRFSDHPCPVKGAIRRSEARAAVRTFGL
ncbi:MAG: hypothetical protein IJC47_00710, partial [Alistipes sp.]|nr:hypothetical protein [Alistipes sp.]